MPEKRLPLPTSAWGSVAEGGAVLLVKGWVEPADQIRAAGGGCPHRWFLCGPVHHLAKVREMCHGQLLGCWNPAVALWSSCVAGWVPKERSRGLASASRAMGDLGQIVKLRRQANPAQQAGESSEEHLANLRSVVHPLPA